MSPGFSWVESGLLAVTSRLSSCIFISASLGAMVNPLLIAYLMDSAGNLWFCYVLVAQTVALSLVFLGLNLFNHWLILPRYGPPRNKTDSLGAKEKMVKPHSDL